MSVLVMALIVPPGNGSAMASPQASAESAASLLPAEAVMPPPPRKSERLAAGLSLAAMTIPIGAGAALMSHAGGSHQDATGAVLIGTGFVFGPAVGHFYGGCGSRGLGGVALRAAISGIVVASYVASESYDGPGYGIVIGIPALATLGILGLYDTVKAAECVRRRNEASGSLGFMVSPGVDPRSLQFGLHLSY